MRTLIENLVLKAKESVPAGLDPVTWIDVYNRRFAELIIKETLKQVNDNMQLTWPDIESKITRNFGITCGRCGKVHTGKPFDEQTALEQAGDEIAREIDRMVMSHAGLIHEGGGYSLSTHEKQAEWDKNRNYTYGADKK